MRGKEVCQIIRREDKGLVMSFYHCSLDGATSFIEDLVNRQHDVAEPTGGIDHTLLRVLPLLLKGHLYVIEVISGRGEEGK